MGTFHDGKGDLHGITVVLDTAGPRVYVGRCEEMTGEVAVLHDADVFDETPEKTKDDYLRRAAAFGVWKKHDRLVVSLSDVRSVRRLGDVSAG
ncbi:MAG: hypothetical protein HY719_05965 [Planctomycetes bacterium]|nr:hypothetical protein [Planctomycetota bacterium]